MSSNEVIEVPFEVGAIVKICNLAIDKVHGSTLIWVDRMARLLKWSFAIPIQAQKLAPALIDLLLAPDEFSLCHFYDLGTAKQKDVVILVGNKSHFLFLKQKQEIQEADIPKRYKNLWQRGNSQFIATMMKVETKLGLKIGSQDSTADGDEDNKTTDEWDWNACNHLDVMLQSTDDPHIESVLAKLNVAIKAIDKKWTDSPLTITLDVKGRNRNTHVSTLSLKLKMQNFDEINNETTFILFKSLNIDPDVTRNRDGFKKLINKMGNEYRAKPMNCVHHRRGVDFNALWGYHYLIEMGAQTFGIYKAVMDKLWDGEMYSSIPFNIEHVKNLVSMINNFHRISHSLLKVAEMLVPPDDVLDDEQDEEIWNDESLFNIEHE
eukprot:81897_1